MYCRLCIILGGKGTNFKKGTRKAHAKWHQKQIKPFSGEKETSKLIYKRCFKKKVSSLDDTQEAQDPDGAMRLKMTISKRARSIPKRGKGGFLYGPLRKSKSKISRTCQDILKQCGQKGTVWCYPCSKSISARDPTVAINHAMRHLDKPFFACVQCEYSCTSLGTMCNHLKKKHGLNSVGNYVDQRDGYQDEIMGAVKKCYEKPIKTEMPGQQKHQMEEQRSSEVGTDTKSASAKKLENQVISPFKVPAIPIQIKAEDANNEKETTGSGKKKSTDPDQYTVVKKYSCIKCPFSAKRRKVMKKHFASEHAEYTLA